MGFIAEKPKKTGGFLWPYIMVAAAALFLIATNSKAELHIWLNGIRSTPADLFFKYFTHAGDGLAIAGAVLILLFVKYRYALGTAFTGVFVLVVVQGLKRLVFNNWFRPKYYFENIYSGSYELVFTQGTEPALMYSFPSGHAATAFALFFFLSLISKSRKAAFFCFIFAALAAYSRVYLSFHFTEDILFGSVLGVFLAFSGYALSKKFRGSWPEKSLLSLLRKDNF